MKKQLLALSVLTAISAHTQAFQLETGDDWNIRWDNQFKGNIMARTSAQNKEIVSPHCAYKSCGWWLADDGDLSVDRSGLGLVSTRLDILSELDVIYKRTFGFRISAAGWYDPQYKDSDHPGDRIATWGQPSVSPGKYTDTAKEYHYLGGEILDAFVFGNFEFGEQSWGVRAGRHTIYWGNSLLAVGAINGFGGSMAPLDFNKALSVPGSEAKELFMPTAKITTVGQLTDNLTFNAFYNFEHQRYRLPEAGTFFSPITGLTEDSEFAVFPPTLIPGDLTVPQRAGYDGRHKDKHASGDWGINFQYYVDRWNLETSFIYMNYVDKNLHGLMGGVEFARALPVILGGRPAIEAPCADPAVCPAGFDDGVRLIGDAYWTFKEDISLYGLSFAKEIAGISVGLDIVYREDTGLAQGLGQALTRAYAVPVPFEAAVAGFGFDIIRDDFFSYDSDKFGGPVGDTWSVVLNGVGLLNDNGIWEGGSYIFEVTAAMLESCNENCQIMDTRIYEDRVVTNIAGVFKPTWYQVRPGWDLTIPMSLSYTVDGEKSPFTFGGDEEGGSASIGVELSIDQIWTVNAAYNSRFGPVLAGIGGLLKDRDNISMTVKRTF